MSLVRVIKREITVRAVLDIISPEQQATLDEVSRLLVTLKGDPAISIILDDVERLASTKTLPRMPKAPREVRQPKPPKPPPGPRKKTFNPGNMSRHAITKRAVELMECFEGDEWISASEIARIIGRPPQYVRRTMEMLIEAGVFRHEQRANEVTLHMEPHYQMVTEALPDVPEPAPEPAPEPVPELPPLEIPVEAEAEELVEEPIEMPVDPAPEVHEVSDEDLGVDLLDLDVDLA